jgi:putative hydrolase of the HAD superfamily
MPLEPHSDIHCILFDAVGTLIYPDPPVAEVYHAAARDFGSRFAAREVHSRFREALAKEHGADATDPAALSRPPTSEVHERQRWQRIVRRVIDDVDSQAASALFERLWEHFARPEHWRCYEDVEPAIEELVERGCRLGIASNFDRRLPAIVAAHRPLSCFNPVFVSSEVGFVKPDPRFFAAVTAHLGVPAAQILLVGDDERNDFHAAAAFGWRSVLLDRALGKTGPAVIPSLTRLSSVALPDI